MGSAMDLCAGCPEVIITMLHTQKGNHKILKKCALPLTAERCVTKIITEMKCCDGSQRRRHLGNQELHLTTLGMSCRLRQAGRLHKDPAMKAMEEE